jgi:hypothetical protein
MDKVATLGIASHWSSGEKKPYEKMQEDLKTKYQFFNNLVEINSLFKDNEKFINQIKLELFEGLVYAYTPQGDEIELPKGATILDFAFKISDEVGNKAIKAIVNDQFVDLNYVIHNNDIIKVITNDLSIDHKENLEEIRLEKGLAAELDKTAQIIKRTGMFDTVDRIYGEPGAEYQEEQQQGGPEGMEGGMPGGGGGSFGGGLDDLGAPGMEGEGDISGEEGVEPTEEMGLENGGPEQPEAPEQPMESKIKDVNKLLTEQRNRVDALFSEYIKKVDKKEKNKNNESLDRVDIYDKSLLINDEFDSMIKSINQISKESPKRKNKK